MWTLTINTPTNHAHDLAPLLRSHELTIGAVHMLPETEDWTYETMWLPAQFVDFDLSRTNSEYKFKWIEGIVWGTEDPRELTFHRSLAQWEEITSCESLREEQIGTVRLPECFKPVGEDAASLDPQLSQLFLLAVPMIAQILTATDPHPVLHHFETHFKSTSWNVQASLDWMRKCLFQPSPALHQMLTPALAALSAHSLMRSDPTANRKIWGPGLILFQLLAIQRSLNEPWDLNGDTFLRIQAGILILSPPEAVEGLDAMWRSTDPIVRAKESQITTAGFGPLEETFKAAHAVYETSSTLIFYRPGGNGTPGTHPSSEPIRIQHIGRVILFSQDLPSAPKKPRKKRAFEGEDVFQEEPKRKQAKKYLSQPTPPHARRSTRLKLKARKFDATSPLVFVFLPRRPPFPELSPLSPLFALVPPAATPPSPLLQTHQIFHQVPLPQSTTSKHRLEGAAPSSPSPIARPDFNRFSNYRPLTRATALHARLDRVLCLRLRAHTACICAPAALLLPPLTKPELAPTLLPTQRRLAQIVEMIQVVSFLHDDASAPGRGVPSAPATFGNKLAQHRPLAPRQHRGR
ncbi:hypothetical protein K438DRAFT_2002537 [Mycena galopus ATCC 62051]|nr:hypothetical protein K438DRAFT_2002537 [Mycena galopus ATCC 62051]